MTASLQNRKAFLDMLKYSEGTARIPESDNGYAVIVGGATFPKKVDGTFDYSKHPNIRVYIAGIKDYSTAAGAYQLLNRWYAPYCKMLGLKDFSPASQDSIAIQQIKECRALDDIDSGNLEVAIKKCSRIWASLPGNGYGQPTRSLANLKSAYLKAGGQLPH